MLDPILPKKAQQILQQAKSSGLQSLLKVGPITGKVVTSEGGRSNIAFQGRTFQLDTPHLPLKPGQQVIVRQVGQQIVIEPLPQPKPQAQSSAAGSLSHALIKMGIGDKGAEIIAKAMLGAGIPLEPKALKDLTQRLPQISSEQTGALQFLLSRGLPISFSLLPLVSQLLMQRNKPAETLDRIIERLKNLHDELTEEEWEEFPIELRGRIRGIRLILERQRFPLKSHSQPIDEEELKRLIQKALATPEALIHQGEEFDAALGPATVQLLADLLKLQALLGEGGRAQALQALIEQVQELHEMLSGQAMQNLPPQTEAGSPVYFIQIPFQEGERKRDLEIRYCPKEDQENAGLLELRLELTQLGPLYIHLYWNSPQIDTTITVTSSEVYAWLEEHLPELQEAMREKGYPQAHLSVQIDNVPETLRPERLKEENVSFGGFDIQA